MIRLATACLAVAALVQGAVSAAPGLPERLSAVPPSQRSPGTAVRLPMFRDVARAAGLDFVHVNGASENRFLPEIMGPGGLFFDVDNDGWLDVFLVDGGSVADATVASRARHRVYRNRRNGTFDSGIQTALQSMLLNMEFIFRFERTPDNVAPGRSYAISDLELASRLSYFLWSTSPDEQLISIASQGKLRDPQILEQRIRRRDCGRVVG